VCLAVTTVKINNNLLTMTIVGCFIFPHGAITLDPLTRDFSGIPAVRPTSRKECIKLHEAMTANAKSLVDLRPDLIILSTPHGLKLQNNFLFVGNSMVKGDAQWDGDWTDFTAEFNIDYRNSESLVKYLRDGGNLVELLSIGAVTDRLPLRWGEVIPWWFINNAAEKAGYQLPPVILLGHPSRRNADTEIMIPELMKLGENIFDWTESDDNVSQKKIAVVISSDLSHYHSADPTSPYPYSEFASVFDGFISEWAGMGMNSSTEKESHEKLVSGAGALVNRIGTCGYTGLVTVHGLLKKAVQKGFEFPATMIYYAAPTYYGMMVNNFILPK